MFLEMASPQDTAVKCLKKRLRDLKLSKRSLKEEILENANPNTRCVYAKIKMMEEEFGARWSTAYLNFDMLSSKL